jgi:hypothetical protein
LIDKKTVFALGAGASCPYGYPSGARLRELICFDEGFWQNYNEYLRNNQSVQDAKDNRSREVNQFRKIFKDANIKSIDVFMADNPKLAPIGKYIIAYEVFRAEKRSLFGEQAKITQESLLSARELGRFGPRDLLSQPLFLGGDWYFYLYNRIIEGLVGKDALPDFSDGKLVFITFNYDRSLEQFFYEALRNSFTEISEDDIVKSLKKLKILHVYGQIAPLKWQNPSDYVDYKPQPNESLLQRAVNNIRTIYEEKQNPELKEAQKLLSQAEQIFFLGFGYAPENMEVLGLPEVIPPIYCQVYGTALGLNSKEVKSIRDGIIEGLRADELVGYKNKERIKIKNKMDCLELLRNYL